MRVLLVNDDGIDAQGMALVEKLVARHVDDLWVIAPLKQQSGKSRSITLYDEIGVHPRGHQRYAIDGSPVDCTLLGLSNLMANNLPDLVISGMNMGANLAEDVAYSGTCGAGLEAALWGIPALALSQMQGASGCDIDLAERLLDPLLGRLMTSARGSSYVLNVNLPNFAIEKPVETHVVPLGMRSLDKVMQKVKNRQGIDFYSYTDRPPRYPDKMVSDLDVVHSGHISITPLQPTYANDQGLDFFKNHFAV